MGSSLIGQQFEGEAFCDSRPSAGGYDGAASGAAKVGPTNPDLLAEVRDRADRYRSLNGLSPDAPVPIDAVTNSASGLDPDISVDNARSPAESRERVER